MKVKIYKVVNTVLLYVALILFVIGFVVGVADWAAFGDGLSGYKYTAKDVTVVWADEASGLYAVLADDRIYSYSSAEPLAVNDTVRLMCSENGIASDIAAEDIIAVRNTSRSISTRCILAGIGLLVILCTPIICVAVRNHKKRLSQQA